MLELIGYERTGFLVLINIVMFLCVIQIFKPSMSYPYYVSFSRRLLGVLILFLFCEFAFWGNDWFHIASSYESLRSGERTHMEDVYQFLIQNICSNYLVFRALVWGSALYCFKKTIEQFGFNEGLAWFCFSAIGLLWFSYARASLSMALVFLGFALYSTEPSTRKRKLLGILVICASYFFHKSSLFGICIVLFALHIKKINKFNLFVLAAFIPFVFLFLQIFLSKYMMLEGDAEGSLWSKGIISAQNYLVTDEGASGLGLLIQQILERGTYICTALLCLRVFVTPPILTVISKQVVSLMALEVILVIIAGFFLFDLGFNTSLIADRFFRFAFIPTSLIVCYLLEKGIYVKFAKKIILLAVASTLYELLYCFYMCNI